MRSIEVSARSIEEAVSDGLDKLGCSISDCKVEILQEGAKGLFGFFGSKPATVRLTLTGEDDDEMDLQSAPVQEKPKKKAPEKKPEEKSKMRIASTPQVVDRPVREKKAPAPKTDMVPRQPKAPREEREQHVEVHEPVPAPDNIEMHSPDSLEGRAQIFLLDVTKRMGVDVQVEVKRGEDGHIFATMYGDTLGILIGRRGETLDSLQYLTSLQVNRGQDDYTRVTLDTENYRAKREEALVRLANRMASRAIKTGRKVSLEPMNPYERRILHSSLQGNESVTTHSEGDEPYRHVVIVPAK